MPALRRCLWLAAFAGLCALGCGSETQPQKAVFYSDAYPIDRIYRSMQGPLGVKHVAFRAGEPELLWMTGFEAEIVAGEGDEPVSPEFMCHGNLDFADSAAHSKLLRAESAFTNDRIFTLSQGQMKIELPRGFGLPILSTERLALTTQVLNLNPQEEARDVRHKTTVTFLRDRDLDRPMKALYMMGLQSMVLLEGDDGFVEMPPGGDGHASSCSLGAPAHNAIRTIEDPFGRTLASHWVVEPGRHVYRTPVTGMMEIPAESTTVHFIAVHLHAFAESLELRDYTTGETLFKSRAENRDDRIGLRHVEAFSSEEGIPIYADHGYELVATYHNTSDQPQDSMAVMFVYALDPTFRHPEEGDV